ncbi:hypothetical protein [Maribacter sp. 2210JD10-5]|uniref:hypothetical protein n=1 Tax=Maribacter sp. 2210JD10-5 TaxID=3386272 RepID=UPI0039BCD3CB
MNKNLDIYIEGERLDLYDNENIVINSSVQNVNDISKIFSDYSQSFTVPASKKNNRIFKHYYNASITGGFDARVKKPSYVELSKQPFKDGNIRLESVKLKDNRPDNYSIRFFSNLTNLNTLFGEDTLQDLDFTDYDFTYSSATVFNRMTIPGQIIFPLISTQKQWYYNDDNADFTNTERLTNIAFNNSTETHGIFWKNLRPAIRLMRVIEAIEDNYGITFSRDFLGTTPFDDLYIWLDRKDTGKVLEQDSTVKNYDEVLFAQPAIGSYNNETGFYSPTESGSEKIRVSDVRVNSSDGVPVQVQLMNNDEVVYEETHDGINETFFAHDFGAGVNIGSNIYVRLVTSAAKQVDEVLLRIKELSEDTVLFTEKYNFSIDALTFEIVDFIPEMKIGDFISSLIKMYNLTILPLSSTSFEVKNLDSWYNEGITYDISKYVDRSEHTVKTSKLFSEIDFTFLEPTTILNLQYESLFGRGYGDLQAELKDSEGTKLDGGKYTIDPKFEQFVYENLTDTNIVYGLTLDDKLEPNTPKAHIFYNKMVNVTTNPISYINDTGNNQQVSTTVSMPSHFDGTDSTNFGEEVDEHTNVLNSNSLFSKYYQNYITDTFSEQSRMFEYKAKLPVYLITNLKLNDKLIIDGVRYLINDMQTNISTQQVNFKLLNDIY